MKAVLKYLATVAVALPLAAAASPPLVEGGVLDSVAVHESGSCAWLAVNFAVPVGYLHHFPRSAGDQLRIDVQLLKNMELLAEGTREAVQQVPKAPFNVRWISYEAKTEGRGALIIDFTGATSFKVGQGGDFRSIVITVPAKDGQDACVPEAVLK